MPSTQYARSTLPDRLDALEEAGHPVEIAEVLEMGLRVIEREQELESRQMSDAELQQTIKTGTLKPFCRDAGSAESLEDAIERALLVGVAHLAGLARKKANS